MPESERTEDEYVDLSGDLSSEAYKPFALDFPDPPRPYPEANGLTDRERLMRYWGLPDWEKRDSQ